MPAVPVELYRLFRELRPDIVHTHNPKPGMYGRLASKAARIPLIVNTQHGLYAQADLDAASRSRVKFLGMRRDVHEIYWAFDIFLLASHREGFPRSAMEAAASGLPVITTDIRGCRDVVDDGRTGLLTPGRNSMMLESAIAKLVDDEAKREEMAVAARQKAEGEFGQQTVIAKTLAAYERRFGESTGRAGTPTTVTPASTSWVTTAPGAGGWRSFSTGSVQFRRHRCCRSWHWRSIGTDSVQFRRHPGTWGLGLSP